MTLFKKTAFPGKYIQGDGAASEIPKLLESFGGPGLLIVAPAVADAVVGRIKSELPAGTLVEKFNGECCEKEVSRLSALLEGRGASCVVAIGGGKAIDAGKIVADRAKLPVVVVPTAASTDAPCSGCAVLYSESGVFQAVLRQRSNPAVVLADSGVIARAPVRLLVAGMGDALSTWFEARACVRSGSGNECGGVGSAAAIAMAKLCYDTLLEHGAAAKVHCEKGIVSPALERVIEANILLSGVGFESVGEAAAHAIHNGLTALPATSKFMHGEKVAFGTLAELQLADTPAAETAAVYGFCEQVGLPTTLAEIGLANVTREELLRVAEIACAPGGGMEHEAGKTTPERALNAMLAADAIGAARKRA